MSICSETPIAPRTRRGSQAGLSATEVLLIASILTALVTVLVQLALRAADASRYAPAVQRAHEINRELLQQLRADLLGSVRLFQDGPIGAAYLDLLDMTDASPAIEGVLPATGPEGLSFSDTGAGNTLLFARHAWTDEFECSSGNRYSVDVYQLVRNYLAETSTETDRAPVLNFCRWVSEPLVDGTQVDAIRDATDRAEVLDHLLSRSPDVHGEIRARVEVVWRPGEDPADPGTLREIGAGGFLSRAPLPSRGPQWTLRRDAGRSSNGLLDSGQFSVSGHAADDLAAGGDPQPRGFEVQITGPSGARRVLLEMVIVSSGATRLPARSTLRVAVNTRDV